METIFVPLALLAGGLLPIQAGANAQLSKSVASPFAATTLQLMVGAAVLLLITSLATRLLPWPVSRTYPGGMQLADWLARFTSFREFFCFPG